MQQKRQIDGIYNNRPGPVHSDKVHQTPSLKSDGKEHVHSKRSMLIPLLVLVAAGLVIGLYKMAGGNNSLVPKNIQSSVDFSVYYPDVKKLPAGYSLDAKSFRLAQPGVVLFAVEYGNGKNIVFSEEQQPSASDINKFISSYIPVNTVLSLSLGQARIGAYGSASNLKTVASLPVHEGPWLIITAPSDVSHDDLTKIMKSLTD